MFCPKCGTQIPNNARFCPKCGAQINTPATQPLNNVQQNVVHRRSVTPVVNDIEDEDESKSSIMTPTIKNFLIITLISDIISLVVGFFIGLADEEEDFLYVSDEFYAVLCLIALPGLLFTIFLIICNVLALSGSEAIFKLKTYLKVCFYFYMFFAGIGVLLEYATEGYSAGWFLALLSGGLWITSYQKASNCKEDGLIAAAIVAAIIDFINLFV